MDAKAAAELLVFRQTVPSETSNSELDDSEITPFSSSIEVRVTVSVVTVSATSTDSVSRLDAVNDVNEALMVSFPFWSSPPAAQVTTARAFAIRRRPRSISAKARRAES